MDSDDVVESTLRLKNNLEKFINHVEELGNEDDPTGDGFTREFKVIRDLGLRMREENTYPADEGRKPCNIKKNRYKDILPFDATRVSLDELAGEEGSDYINANFIQDLNGYKSYIASQGPVAATVYDFLRMIIQYKVKVVAMACRTIEMGKKKCEEYWPSELNETIEFRDLSVTLVGVVEIAEHCSRRELRLSRSGSDSHSVTQFHYTGWPDHDIPHDFDVILEMIAEMREIKSQDVDKAPMVIHCSAGCGRTGTICAIDYSWDLLKSGKLDEEFSLYDIVKKMREQRQSMIQAPEQYRMAHVTVQTLFQKHLDLMEDHTYGNLTFSDGTEDHSGENIYSHVSDAGSETSSLGLPPATQRKDSILSQEIASTIAKATHHSSQDDVTTPVAKTSPMVLQEPLTPVAVYNAEPLSPKVDEIRGKFSNESFEPKTFPVVKIDHIPSSGGDVKKRYTDNVSKQEVMDRKLSYMPSDSKRLDLESKKKLFESGQKSSPEPAKAYIIKSTVETNNDTPVSLTQKIESVSRPKLERIQSRQTDNKHVTVLNIGGGHTNKTAVNKTMSVPARNVTSAADKSRSSTLPAGRFSNPFNDSPQSSVPPLPPSKPTDSVYSYAGNSSFFTTTSSDDSPVPSSTIVNQTGVTTPGVYSQLCTYQSGTVSTAPDAYSVVHQGHVNNPVMNASTSNYSYATEPGISGNMYSTVNRNGSHSQNHQALDGVYESVSVGNISPDKNPPVIPSRGYLDDDTDTSGDVNTLGRKAQITSAIKNLFKGGQNSTSDVVVPSDLPGYMVKIGRIPRGPRDHPVAWRKK